VVSKCDVSRMCAVKYIASLQFSSDVYSSSMADANMGCNNKVQIQRVCGVGDIVVKLKRVENVLAYSYIQGGPKKLDLFQR